MPEICKYDTLHGEGDFSDVIKLRILKWIDYPGLFGWAKYNHKGLNKKEVVDLETIEGVKLEAGVIQERGHESRSTGGL